MTVNCSLFQLQLEMSTDIAVVVMTKEMMPAPTDASTHEGIAGYSSCILSFDLYFSTAELLI